MDVRQVLLVLAALVGLASCLENDRFVQLQDGKSLMITSSRSSRYALSSELFLAENWRTVSVDGNNLTIVTPNCSKIETSFERLSEAQRTMFDFVLSPFEIGADSERDPNIVGEFSIDDVRIKSTPMTMERFGSEDNWYTMRRVSRANFSVAGGDLGPRFGISRFYIVDDLVAIAYPNGKVEMTPQDCLNGKSGSIVRMVLREHKEQILLSRTNEILVRLEQAVYFDPKDHNNQAN